MTRPPPVGHGVADRRGQRRVRRSPRSSRSLEEGGERRVDEAVAALEERASGGHDGGGLGRAGEDRLEDPEQVGLLLVHLHPRGGQPPGRRR